MAEAPSFSDEAIQAAVASAKSYYDKRDLQAERPQLGLDDGHMAIWPNVVARRAPELVLTRHPPSRSIGRTSSQMAFCRRTLRSILLGLAIKGLIGSPAVVAAELSCAHYAVFKKLPNGFREIASGSLVGGAEIFVLSNGYCCDNGPALSRYSGRPAPLGEHWSCRHASGDELEVR
ncbi:hypothetical protein ONR75_19920 [Rhodopseudomonas sp. P2A-2r]|uniref:hypothetical protein n=1 Tax=Rhodopseudomonas sp. P2A-2r TaxID=2991972 RepID=UPI002234A12A|nr:hypothetical protein [Rhodopseudomonas sp. P2A-2r]UZE47231.1 hypothetical protein ONR75_19920 [Rhodopseudomonas sp. P2A-2r]